MNHTEDLVYWPLLRWLDPIFLAKIYQFYMLDEGHSCLLVSKSNQVFGFGRNLHGCLGLGHQDRVDQPVLIKELRSRVFDFYVGSDFALAFTYSGKLFGWSWDQLEQNQPMEVENVSNDANVVADSQSSVQNVTTQGQATPKLLFTGVSQVSVGLKHAAIVKSGKLIILHSKNLANVVENKFLDLNEDIEAVVNDNEIKIAWDSSRKRARHEYMDVDEFNEDDDDDFDDDDSEDDMSNFNRSIETHKKKVDVDSKSPANAKLFARAVFDNVSQVTCCYEATLILTNDSQLYALGDFVFTTFQEPTLVQLDPKISIKMMSAGRTDFLLLNPAGTVYHCHWDREGQFRMKTLDNLIEPITRVLSRWEYNYFALTPPSSSLVTYIWEPMPRLSRTNLSAMDAYSLYAHSVTLALTSYTYQARMRTVEWFNDPSHSSMVIMVDTRAIYINRDILAKASPHFASLFEGEWAGCERVHLDGTRFPVLFTYLRLLQLPEATNLRAISEDLKSEIVNLAEQHGTTLKAVLT